MMRVLLVSSLLVLIASTAFGLPNYVTTQHFELNGQGYLVEYPAGGFTDAEVPLIVLLHGGGGDSDGYNMYTHMYRILENNDAVLLFPQGELEGYTWVPSDRFWIWDIVEDLMVKMETHFPGHVIDTSRIYALGSSYGGWMAHLLGYMESNHYAAIATVNGGWPGNQFESLGPPPDKVGVIMFHNRFDNVVRIGQSSAVAADLWSQWNDAPNYSVDRDNDDYWIHSCTDNEGVEWVRLYELKIRINGTSNHTWPHLDTYGIEPVVHIWPFFQQFSRGDGDFASDGDDKVVTPVSPEYGVSAYPNPFNVTGTVALALPEEGRVRVTVHNMLGQTVATLADESLTAGLHQFTIDGSNLASGVYIVSAVVEGRAPLMQKLVLMK